MSLSARGRWSLALLAGISLAGGPASLSAQPPKTLDRGEELPLPQKLRPAAAVPGPPASILDNQAEPIDLDSALRLAGVRNPEILLARERVVEAVALHQLAAVQLLPTINSGNNYDGHTGPLQQSSGTILKVNRSAYYLGLGAGAVGAGTVQIPGLVVSGNVAEGIFAELAARQVVRQREFASQAVRNEILLRVAGGYLELLRAQGRRAIALKNRQDAAEAARVITAWAQVGEERKADADRALVELEQRDADVVQAEEEILAAAAHLAELLDLDPAMRLRVTDGWVVPAPIVPDPIPLPELLAIALVQRPELKERQAAIRAALLALEGAKALPFSPNVILGYSAGTFGGGSNLAAAGILQANGTILQQSRFGNFGDRQDLDVVLYWSLRNLGLGNVAQVRLARSHARAEELRGVEVLDRVRAEVATAYAAAHSRFAQIETTERAVQSAQRAFAEDLLRTRNRQGLPIEVLDSMRLLGRSRNAYLDAIIDYNRAHVALYVALGQPPASTLARPVPADLVPAPAPPSLAR